MKAKENGSARRATFAAGVKKPVSIMPSGPKMRARSTSLSRAPSTISTIAGEHVGRDAVLPDRSGLVHQRQGGHRLDVLGRSPLGAEHVRSPHQLMDRETPVKP